jgi:hypothetical protein
MSATHPNQQNGDGLERSRDQKMDALALANEIRGKRASLKRELKAGRVKVHSQIAAPPEWLATAKVIDLLLAVPKIGRVKANKALVQCRISPSKTVGGLSDRQRRELVDLLAR